MAAARPPAWVTYADEQAHYEPARWARRQVEETNGTVPVRASSMLMHSAPEPAAAHCHPLLERLTPPIPELAADYWIVVHRDLRRSTLRARY